MLDCGRGHSGIKFDNRNPQDWLANLANKTKPCPSESLFLFCVDQESNLHNIALPAVLAPCFPGHDPSWYFWLHFPKTGTSLAHFWKEFASWRPGNTSWLIAPFAVVAGYCVARWI